MAAKQKKAICLITPGHLASNPRLIKEAVKLDSEGFRIHLIFTQNVEELVKFDQKILADHPNWTSDCLNWTGTNIKSKINKIISGVIQRTVRNGTIFGLSTSINRHFYWQLKRAKAFTADIYIAHNLGALPVAVLAAKKNAALSGFDAEDFHRHESSDDINDKDVKLKIAIEDKYFPLLNYFSHASPLIGEEYYSLYHKTGITILNVFQKTTSLPQHNLGEPLKILWLSQTIGKGRGIELIIETLNGLPFSVEFHLIGKLEKNYLSVLKQLHPSHKLYLYGTVSEQQLFKIASACDLGMASEESKPLNRNICLTNKLFIYIQSGLAVLASNTAAQQSFLKKFSTVGKLYNNKNELEEVLINHQKNRAALYLTKKQNFDLGQNELNWDIESKKFLNNLLSIING